VSCRRAAEGSHLAARFWRPPWSLDRGPSASDDG